MSITWKEQDSSQRLGGDWVGGKAASSRRSPKMPSQRAQIRERRDSALPNEIKCRFLVSQKALHSE